MERRLLFAVAGLATLLLFVAAPVTGAPPTRIPFEFDETFPSGILTAACGIPVFVHAQGGGTTTLYYDQSGTQVVREFDTLAEGLTSTFFSPIEQGGTGKSFTDVTHQPSTFVYPNGTAIGDPAIVILNGVQRTSGPGNPRLVGHEVDEGVIIGYTASRLSISWRSSRSPGSLTWPPSWRRAAHCSPTRRRLAAAPATIWWSPGVS